MTKSQTRKLKARKPSRPASGITVGDISGGTNIAIGDGAQANHIQVGLSGEAIADAFQALQQKVNALPDGPDKTVAQKAVQELQAEAQKGEQASQNTVEKWLAFLAEAAPDAWDVAIETFLHPIRGVATIFRKIAERARLDREAKKAGAGQK
jgi:hypothetical protein